MGRHRKKRTGFPVRTGLLGVSAAMAVGAVAFTSGILPGGDTYTVGSSSSDRPAEIRTGGPALLPQGEGSIEPTAGASASPSRTAEPSKPPAKPSSSKSAKPVKPSATPSKKPVEKTAEKTRTPEPKKTTSAPAREESHEADRPQSPPPSTAAAAPSDASAHEATVLDLVNDERAKVGCAPVKASTALANLARAHSKDMAVRGFFDHTNPDGATPWDRADKAGVSDLGGENIARGQADAGAVMNAWMQSEGHRANILNCDFTTMGVGGYLGDGGPWWTQNFGF
ncbi:CAP domain-containing protein [Streptomyces sp. NPDC018833]|uniref:CAP domain-containing protein n=1 Tax=Streptomyces sp. NPDC018833 TaxID=3365053 RepID=UPI003792CB35